MKVHASVIVLALMLGSLVLLSVRSVPCQLNQIFVKVLNVNVSHFTTYPGATINVNVTVEITWDVFDFSGGYVDTFYDGNLISRRGFIVIWQGHTINYFNFDWNTSGIEIGSHSISVVAVGSNIDTYVDGSVQILPVGNINTKQGYPTIQNAINNASQGDTIFVSSGTYSEDIIVNRTVSLNGESLVSTVINGTLTVLASNVEIARFRVDGGEGVELEDVMGCKVTQMLIRNSRYFGIVLLNASDSQISLNEMHSSYYDGICLDHSSSNNTIASNLIEGFNRDGIGVHQSTFNRIEANKILSEGPTTTGLHIRYASNNTFKANSIMNCSTGIWAEHSHNNTMYHNSFINNSIQTSVPDSESNAWDTCCEGNYWSDYNGTDSNGDGISDTQYIIDETNTDRYPLMNVFWNPTDINHDLRVNMKDVGNSARAFNTTPGDTLWNTHADITGPIPLVPDSKVDMRDISLIAKHFGEHY